MISKGLPRGVSFTCVYFRYQNRFYIDLLTSKALQANPAPGSLKAVKFGEIEAANTNRLAAFTA
jgi:hypothetical protein